MKADPKDIAGLARRLLGIERELKARKTPQLAFSSIEDGALKAFVGDKQTMAVGAQFDGTNGAVALTGPTPIAPTKPTLSAAPEMLEVSWDGLLVDEGAVLPLDFLRVDVHVTLDPVEPSIGIPPLRSITSARGGGVSISREPGTYRVALVVRTVTGKASALSESAAITVPAAADGGFTPPTEVPPAVTDVKLSSFAIRALEASWDAAQTADAYDVYLGTTANFPLDAAHLAAGAVEGTRVVLSQLAGASLGAVPHWVAVVPLNVVGSGTATRGGPATPRLASNEDISADFVYAGSVEAITAHFDKLSALSGELGSVSVGERISIAEPDTTSTGDPTGGITIYAPTLDDQGQKTELIRLHPNGSVFRGQVVADDVSVLNGLVLQGTLSRLTSGSGLTIESSVSNPTVAPTVLSTTVGRAWPAVGSGYIERGIDWDPGNGCWWRVAYNASIRRVHIAQINADHTLNSSTIFDLDPVTFNSATTAGANASTYPIDISGIVRVNGFWYTWFGFSDDVWALAELGAGNYQRAYYDGSQGRDTRYPFASPTSGKTNFLRTATPPTVGRRGNGTESTEVAVAALMPGASETSADVRLWTVTTGGGSTSMLYASGQVSATVTSTLDNPLNGFLRSCGVDIADPGVPTGAYTNGRLCWIAHQNRVFFFNALAAQPLLPACTFTVDSSSRGGVTRKYTGANQGFYSTSHNDPARTQQYSSFYPAAGEDWWISYDLTDGTSRTMPSTPPVRHAPIARRFVQVRVPPAPSGAAGAGVYVGYGSSAPPNGGYFRRTEALSSARSVLLSTKQTTGSNPATSNGFGAGTSAWIRSQTGGFEVNGDGTGAWPALKAAIDARVKAGVVVIPSWSSQNARTAVVTFDTPFPAGVIPKVFCNLTGSGSEGSTSTGETARWSARALGVSRTGFTVQITAPTTTTTNNTSNQPVQWMAIAP